MKMTRVLRFICLGKLEKQISLLYFAKLLQMTLKPEINTKISQMRGVWEELWRAFV